MFRPFKHFAKAYIDDIIIFSKTINEYVAHFQKKNSVKNASPTKFFIGYSSIKFLK